MLAFWVVLLHLNQADRAFDQLVAPMPAGIRNILQSGQAAVGVFFLLSGFVLAYNYDLGEAWNSAQRRAFWIARLARIYPVYLFALAVGLPSLLAGLLKHLPLHIPELIVAVSLVLTLLQSWIPAYADFWGGPAWSLSVEAFFYLTFPFLGFLLWKITRIRTQIVVIAVLWIAGCSATELLAHLFPRQPPRLDTWQALMHFNPWLRLPEFLAGIILCKLYLTLRAQLHSRRLSPASFGPVLCLAGILPALLVCAFRNHFVELLLPNGLLLPVSAAGLLGLSLGGGVLHRWLSHPTMVFWGQASFSMYLLHMAIYSYFAAGSKRFHHTLAQAWLLDLIFILTVLALSAAAFTFIEEPARRSILKHLQRRPEPAAPSPAAQPASADPF